MESVKEMSDLVEREILLIKDSNVAKKIRELIVKPYAVQRSWDYAAPGDQFVCWTVLEHRESNTAIAYCSQGFGPSYPWGLVAISGPHMSMGTDSGWFVSLEQAFRETTTWDGMNPKGYEVQ